MLNKIARLFGGDPHKREVEKLSLIVDQVNLLEETFDALTDEQLAAKTPELRARLEQGETLDDLLPEAFAAVREASKRAIGQRPFDVQLIGGMVLHKGMIAEMRTGEGKTLTATLPVYLNALEAKGVHVVTVNDYLARRDARWMGQIYTRLGLSVGVLQMASRTENGRMAFLYDPEKTSPIEDQDQLRLVLRKQAYLADVTYGTNSEFGFDYLRDNLANTLSERSQRGHHFAIVDEVDNILIDEARTPLIISGPASDDVAFYRTAAQVVKQLVPEDYEISEKDRIVTLTEIGEVHLEQLLGMPLRDPERPEDVTPEQARMMGYLEQALRAQFLYHRDKDYLIQNKKVIIVDEFTGRLMPGRRWSEGLHQAVEAKEGVNIEPENVTYATITLQNYFRMYAKLSGMTGTALTEAEEFYKIYKLDVQPIPTNLEFQSVRSDAPLVELEAKDEQGYKYNFFARRDDPQRAAIYYRRKDLPDVVFRTEEAKLRAIVREIIQFHVRGRPQLVGTTSVEHSERLSERLRAEPVRRLVQTLLIRQAWLDAHDREDDQRAIPELQSLYQPVEALQPGELRQMARPLGLNNINPEDESNLPRVLPLLNLGEEDVERLKAVMQGGVPHQVLNARKHDEESQIIARAGAFGAVTIATNMAGRGVDIKLGGDLDEAIINDVNRILSRTGEDDPYDMNMEQRFAALEKVDPAEYGIYADSALAFLKYINDMRRVRELGGLHVIGSERHEARRIDNQLRGRAARQGDPGSSRFYLSLADDLMRLFGGQQVEGLMARLNIDESMPIEHGLVDRMVEQSQTRVEGYNFDARKHLLEYDDVLNAQRTRIYNQRDKVFTKEDLREDVTEMLRTELNRRIPVGLKDEEGPWKLLAYLESVQPTIDLPGGVIPSYTLRLLLPDFEGCQNSRELKARLLELAEKTLKAQHEHLLRSLKTALERAAETLEKQVADRGDALDSFIDSFNAEPDEGELPMSQRKPKDVVDELSRLVGFQLRLSNEQTRQLMDDPRDVQEDIRQQIQDTVLRAFLPRIVMNVESRLGESLNFHPTQAAATNLDTLQDELLLAVENNLGSQENRLLGESGSISRDLDGLRERVEAAVNSPDHLVRLLEAMAFGEQLAFDARHQKVKQRTVRLRYIYLAAARLSGENPQQVTDDVLEHLEDAQEKMCMALGETDLAFRTQAGMKVSGLEERVRNELAGQLGEEYAAQLADVSVQELDAVDRAALVGILGRRIQSDVYRRLLLQVISGEWVEYLTRIEALRVSISMESYAQRDPLVQYKGRASELFTELLEQVRAGVIGGMFGYRPRAINPAAGEESQPQRQPAGGKGQPVPAGGQPLQDRPAQQKPSGGKKKHRRH